MARATSQRGIAATEFALWLPIIVVLIAGVLDWGTYMSTRASLQRAVTDGARVGASKFEPATEAAGSVARPAALARARQVIVDQGLECGNGCTLTTSFCFANLVGPCDVSSQGGGRLPPPVDSLLVEVSYTFVPWFGFAFTPDRIRTDFVMAMENQRPGGP
ncbi:MAG: TadE family protein [Myxococcota bacterium]